MIKGYREYILVAKYQSDEIKHRLIEAYNNDDIVLEFRVFDKQRNAVNLSGATANYFVSKNGYYQKIIEKTVYDGITISGNKINVSIASGELSDIGYYDGQLVLHIDSKQSVIAAGKLLISKSIE